MLLHDEFVRSCHLGLFPPILCTSFSQLEVRKQEDRMRSGRKRPSMHFKVQLQHWVVCFYVEMPTAVVNFWDTWHFVQLTLPYGPLMMHWSVAGTCKWHRSDVKAYTSEGSAGHCRVHHVYFPSNVLIFQRDPFNSMEELSFIRCVYKKKKKATTTHSSWLRPACPTSQIYVLVCVSCCRVCVSSSSRAFDIWIIQLNIPDLSWSFPKISLYQRI